MGGPWNNGAPRAPVGGRAPGRARRPQAGAEDFAACHGAADLLLHGGGEEVARGALLDVVELRVRPLVDSRAADAPGAAEEVQHEAAPPGRAAQGNASPCGRPESTSPRRVSQVSSSTWTCPGNRPHDSLSRASFV
eukprot:2401205-Lingulodinium_polyedra.AAC.1